MEIPPNIEIVGVEWRPGHDSVDVFLVGPGLPCRCEMPNGYCPRILPVHDVSDLAERLDDGC